MPFFPVGRFNRGESVVRTVHEERRPAIFYDRVTFQGKGRRIVIENGKLSGLSVLIETDIISSSWDGADPISLPDATATTGYALDDSTGEAQFHAIYAESGELGDLDIEGTLEIQTLGKLVTAASGERFEIVSSGSGTAIQVYSGDAKEMVAGSFSIQEASGQISMNITSPIAGASGPTETGNRGYGIVFVGTNSSTGAGQSGLSAYGVANAESAITLLASSAGSGNSNVNISAASGSGASGIDLEADEITITGVLNMQSNFIDGLGVDSGAASDTTLSAAVNTYETAETVVLPDIGTYYVFTNGYFEASISSDVEFYAGLTIAAVPGTSFAYQRCKMDSALSNSQYMSCAPAGVVTTTGTNTTCSLQVRRNSTSGTQIYRRATIMAIKIG